MGKLQSLARWFVVALIPAALLVSGRWVFGDESSRDPVTEDIIIRCWDEAKMDSVRLMYGPFAASHPNSPVTLFFQAALGKDGHIAARDYQALIEIGSDSSVVPRAMHRLTQYYRSLGDYQEASKWERRLQTNYPSFRAPQFQPEGFSRFDYPYVLQLGAFEHLKNAQKLSQKAESFGLACEIQRRTVNGRTLYLVWAGQFATEDDAEQAGEQLSRTKRMTYRVIARSIPDN